MIVVAILGVLAAVVIVNVVGLMGRGQAEAYNTDGKTIQSAVSTFYADLHAYSSTGGWNESGNYISVHNLPTASGDDSALYPGAEAVVNGHTVSVVMDGTDDTPADTNDIQAAAIWTGLLTNGPGEGNVTGAGPDVAPGDGNSPLTGEHGPYLYPLPKSCSKYNSTAGGGTITWIIGRNGVVYGVFEQGSMWYAGFGGRYP